jgi:ABC-2 type transport system permease protein
VAVAVAMLIAAIITTLAGVAFFTLPGDEIPFTAALSHFTLTGLLILAAGSLAFATAPILGRTRAMGLGLIVLFGGYLIDSYSSLSSIVESLSPVSWYAWTADHRPLAGQTDWASVGLLAAVTAGLIAIGVVAFERRDVGMTVGAGRFQLPGLPAGIGGPFRRQLADRTAVAMAWGIGIGVYAAIIVSSAEEFVAAMRDLPGIEEIVRALYPSVDIGQPSGLLQLVFFTFGSLMIGLAGAGFLAGWASDEERRRLDVVLSTPLSRARWALASGAGVLAAIAITVALVAAIIGITTAALGYDALTPVIGMAVLALAAMAFAGVGLAVGGLVRPTLAAPVTAAVVIGSFLLELLGNALNLPDVIVDLSLNRHLGQPMAGDFDPVGIVISVVLAVGGLAVGAWGLARRDLRG